MINHNIFLSSEEPLIKAWGYDEETDINSVWLYISYLRKRLMTMESTVELDAGLACQNMSVAAQLLGYGTKIISSPTLAVNGENQAVYQEQLGIPEDQTAAAFLLIGMGDTSADGRVDAYAGPTARNPLDEMVTYVEGQ